MTDLLTGLAFFLVIEGLVYALAPSMVKNLAVLLPSIPDTQLRWAGVIALSAGVAAVWFIRAA